jgi:hypothetical protein
MSRSAAAASAVRGGLLVVGVAGHAAVVEHDEQLCPLALRRPHHVGRWRGHPRLGEPAVGGTRVARNGASREPGRRWRARLPAGPQGRRGRAQRRCLTMSEAQSSDRGPGVDKRAEHRSQPERLVVGVGVDGEHRAGPGERSNGADGRPVTVSRGHRTRRGRGCPGPPRDAVLDVELAGDGVLVVGDWGRSARRDGSPFVAHVGGGRDCSRGQRPGRRATQAQPRTTGPAVGREVGNDRQRAPHVVGHVVGEKPRPGSVDISPQRVRAHSCICP